MSKDFRQTLSDDEKADLRKLLGALEHFRTVRSTMPLQYIVTFLLVALDEGDGPTEYARKAGVSKSVMSRHLLDIGDRNRHMEEGFGLITQRPDPMNLRTHQAMLAADGKNLAQKVLRSLKR